MDAPTGSAEPDFRADALHDKGITPATLDPRTPCLGILTDGQCDACVLRVSPMDYEGYFPAVQLIVPDLVERDIGGAKVLVCRNRRTDGTHFPGASVGVESGSVGAVVNHGANVAQPVAPVHPAVCGGCC